MKRLIILNGAMGVGKTAVSRELQKLLPKNVFLDGDWCWDMLPFTVNDETKLMALNNIGFMLRSFMACSEYENIIFCWVMQYQSIIDEVLSRLDTDGCEVRIFSLICSPEELEKRLSRDIADRKRPDPAVIEAGLRLLDNYKTLNTEKVDVSNISAGEAAKEIAGRL